MSDKKCPGGGWYHDGSEDQAARVEGRAKRPCPACEALKASTGTATQRPKADPKEEPGMTPQEMFAGAQVIGTSSAPQTEGEDK